MQRPLRAALDVKVVQPDGRVVRGDAVLVGGKAALTSLAGAPATTALLTTQEGRQEVTSSLYDLDSGGTSFAYTFLALRSDQNRAREETTVEVRVEPLLDGQARLQNVVVTQKEDPTSPPTRYQYGFDSRGQLRRFAFQIQNVDITTRQMQNVDITARFGAPVSNWKGTQARTDALVYNWNAVAPDVKIAAFAQPGAFVEPRARALFARATKLYSGARSLRLKWTVHNGSTNSTDARELRLERDKRLFLRGQFPQFSVAAINSKTALIYSERLNHYIQESTVGRASEAVNNQLVEAANPDPRVPDDAVLQVVGRVDEMNPLKVETVKLGLRYGDIEKLRAKVLPARSFGGEICDLVNITQVQVGPEESTFSPTGVINSRPLLTTQQIFWFARSNGRLVRFQVPGAGGGAIPRIDAQITLQKFNPTFSAKDFAFPLPKSAKQEKYD